MDTKQIAELLNVSESDAESFVNCLRVWTDKGYTIEQAIGRHVAQINRFAAAYNS